MSNPNYEKGRRKEYKLCQELREQGYDIVQRTAGSHSPIDIIAINKKTNEVLLIQSKPDNYSNKEISAFYEMFGWLNNVFEVKVRIR